MKTSVKYLVIYRHKEQYSISEMCRFFKVSRSGYYGYVSRMNIPAKDLPLAEKIQECQNKCGKTYGYRRVHIWLERQGTLYLSVIRDLFDNSIVAYKTGTEQNINLVISTIREAKKREKVTAELQLHSDQGFQYTSNQYFKLTQSYNITPSMSRKGNPYDNAMAENFFSILKTECIYRIKLKSYDEARLIIDEYIRFYNNERIQLKTKLTPLEMRSQYVA